MIVNEPQVVCITTFALVEPSFDGGRFSCVSSWREPGSPTRLQPAGSPAPAVTTVDVPAVEALDAPDEPPPQPPPQPATSAAIASTARGAARGPGVGARIMPRVPGAPP